MSFRSFATFALCLPLAAPAVAQDGEPTPLPERRAAFTEECTRHVDSKELCACTFDRLDRYPGFGFSDAQVQRIAEAFAADGIPGARDMLAESGAASDAELAARFHEVEYATNPCVWDKTGMTPDLPRDLSQAELESFGLDEY